MAPDPQAQSREGISRLTRLPLPRASTDNLRKLRPAASRDDLRHDACVRPNVPNGSRSRPFGPPSPLPLGEASHNAVKQPLPLAARTATGRQRSPVRDALSHQPVTSLETTPPSSTANVDFFADANENSAYRVDASTQADKTPSNHRRRPRPSLSERTMETLALVSPSPTPRRRRSSNVSVQTVMGPPATPAPGARKSRPSIAQGTRHTTSNTIPPVYTPPKAFLRDSSSRIARPTRQARNLSSSTAQTTQTPGRMQVDDSRRAQTMRVRPKSSLPQLNSLYTPKSAASNVQSTPTLQTPRVSPRSQPTTSTEGRVDGSRTRMQEAKSSVEGSDRVARGLYNRASSPLDPSTPSRSQEHFPNLDLTAPVTTLRLASTSIDAIPPTLLRHAMVNPHLQTLDVSHNPLNTKTYLTQPTHLLQLESLSIVNAGISSLDPLTTNLKAPKLRALNISCNRLGGHIPDLKAYFPELRTLIATDNWFTDVDGRLVEDLETLDLRSNAVAEEVMLQRAREERAGGGGDDGRGGQRQG